MINASEIAADIGFKYLTHLLRHDLHPKSLQRVMRISARSKAVTAVQKICFKHRLQNACYRPLKQSVRGRRNSERPRPDFPRPLGYVNSSDRWCAIGALL